MAISLLHHALLIIQKNPSALRDRPRLLGGACPLPALLAAFSRLNAELCFEQGLSGIP